MRCQVNGRDLSHVRSTYESGPPRVEKLVRPKIQFFSNSQQIPIGDKKPRGRLFRIRRTRSFGNEVHSSNTSE